ncbi:RHS repeat-associated core domain-containing protein [Kribbella sp. NPDC058245]|uniref:RHS repeat domain-containing protein n=1 Tax=Kribbella sp. NPDC058245 TaxID=3346399 RepID=UPI0036E82AD9
MPSRRFRSNLVARTAITAGLAVTLILSTQQQGLTAAAATRPDPAFHSTEYKSIDGHTAKADPRPAAKTADREFHGTPATNWPSAGSAEVAVPAPAANGTWQLALNGGRVNQRAKAGQLPVWVAPTDAAAREVLAKGATSAPAKVKVDLVGRRGDALELKVSRADGTAKSGQVTVGVDYREFRDTYGGDWATRLRFTTEQDGKTVVLPTRNNGNGDVIADVPVGAQAQTFMVAAGESSGAGDYKKPDSGDGSSTWSVGGSSGDFEWQMPLDTPPATGGPEPTVGLNYSSGALDGLSSATNNQTSQIGQGFTTTGGGSIERTYKSCGKDLNGNNGTRKTGDLCFAGDSMNISVNGKSGDLVLAKKDASGEVWRMRGDDGAIIERLSGATNGDDGVAAADKGEYWRMTSSNGTKYYFGLNRLPGWATGKEETKSAFTVPVYGNNSGEQCNKTAFADSWCQQAYEWNLDYVVDPNGNTMSLFYNTEIDRYARNLTKASVSTYVRAGNIKRIEYGQTDGQVFAQKPVAQVLFTTAERCTPLPCGPTQKTLYPDTPWDLTCASTTNCDNHYTATFWTQLRLDKVTTQVWRAATSKLEDVQSWSLRQEYLRGDNSSPSLWLKEITPTGLVGTPVQMPATSFDGIPLANRVDTGSDTVPPLEWFRINAVHGGTGGDVAVNYSGIDCLPTGLPAPDNNDRRCRPQKWSLLDTSPDRTDWFHKYVVTSVQETDRTVAADDPWQAPVPVVTSVQYLDKPAWRFEEQDAGTDLKESTWSQWRGFGRVKVIKGRADETQSISETLYFRGLDGDRTAAGGAKDVKITDSTGTAVDDVNEYAGQAREQLVYNGATVVNKSIADYYISAPTATMTRPWGTLTSRYSGQKQLTQYQPTDTGTLKIDTQNSYDAGGRLISKDEAGDLADATDDSCTRYTYVENPTKNLRELPARLQQVAKRCDQPFTNTDVLSDERLFYDDATSPTAVPVKGQITRAERLGGFDAAGQPKYELVYTAKYDAQGRQTESVDALNRLTRKTYDPTYGPITKITEIAPNGQQIIKELEPAFGTETALQMPDGRRGVRQLDAIGRVSKTWDSGHATSGPADLEFDYKLRDDGPSMVTTKRRVKDGVFDISYDLYDGLGRIRQTHEQSPRGGWLVTDNRYDSRGLETKVNGPYYTATLAEGELKVVDEATLPKQEVTVWDAAERPKSQTFRSMGVQKWSIEHTISTNKQTIDPPTGQTPTTRIMDADGNLTELRQYRGDSATGDYDSTKYTYWPSGSLKSVTDPAGSVWSYKYDVQGRKIEENDPDKGISKYEYDAADQLVSTTDSRGVKLYNSYDNSGRKIATRLNAPDGPLQTEWKYDSLAAGRATSSTRYVTKDGKTEAYTTAITGYDGSGRATGTTLTLPASEGKLAGTYTVGQTYTDDGNVATRSLPAAGGLGAETLNLGYNNQGLPTSLAGQDTYVRQLSYTPFEDADVLTLGTASGPFVQQKFEYDQITRRVSRVVVDKELSPKRVSDTRYDYDPGGNIKKITDIAPAESGEATDTQCFDYDYLSRLSKAWTPKPAADNSAGDCAGAQDLGGPAPYAQEWTFDKAGNRKSEKTTTPAGTTTSTYEYGSAKPHALTSVTSTGPAGTKTKTFGYDEVGNTTRRTANGVDEVLEWDASNQLTGTTKGAASTSAVYDAEGGRLIRRDASGTTLYIGETELHLDKAGQTVTGTRYYGFGDRVVAVRTDSKLSWLLGDLQGTPLTAIDSVTQAVQKRRVTPYGETRGAAPTDWPGQRDFHGGTNDPDTGLVQLGARQYDKSIGRFISVDSLIDLSDPRQMNGYTYANHNPISYSDSDGNLLLAIVVPVLIVVLIIVLLLQAMMEPYQQEVTTINWEEKVQNIWDVLKFAWHTVVKLVKVVTTVIVTLWRLIWVVVMKVVAKTVVIYHTIIKHIADKKKPRNNQKAQRNDGKSNSRGNQNRGNNGKGKAQEGNPGKQPPRQQPPRQQQPRKPKGPAQQERVLGREPRPDEPIYRGSKPDTNPKALEKNHYKVDENGMVKPTAGMSVDSNFAKLEGGNWNPKLIDRSSIDPRLMIRQTGKSDTHFEIMPRVAGDLTEADFLGLLDKLKFLG